MTASGNHESGTLDQFPWGNTMDKNRIDMDCKYLARQPVYALPEGESPFMSTLQFGDHKVVPGGSRVTSSPLIRGTCRQAYTPD